jgi:hypothetical protein
MLFQKSHKIFDIFLKKLLPLCVHISDRIVPAVYALQGYANR